MRYAGGRGSLLRFLSDESGQMLPIMAMMMVALLAMTGFALDTGRCLYAYRELQAATDAAALAGAAAILSGNGIAVATQYSAVSGNKNEKSGLPGVTMVSGYPKVMCLSTLSAAGMTCASPGNGNAVQVRQQVSLPLTFLRVVGKTSLTMTAVATASSNSGGARAPYNVAIIMDSTSSMGTPDTDPNCSNTRMNCALAGVRILLQNLSPCGASLPDCGSATNGNVANAVDRVALYTFPAVKSTVDASYEYDCNSSTKPVISYYTDTSFSVNTQPIYQLLDYSSDYKTSANATTLNPNSNLVKAVGGVSGCGMKIVGGAHTYIAGVLLKASTDLINMRSAYPSSQKVIIVLTDGDMNAAPDRMPNASPTSGVYASTRNECQQAAAMAAYAAQNQIKVYSVAYGAAPAGCDTDKSGAQAGITPCQTVAQLASSPENFYSDYAASGGDTNCKASNPDTDLKTIFTQISAPFSSARLIPDNTP